jgi:hypothetical protein
MALCYTKQMDHLTLSKIRFEPSKTGDLYAISDDDPTQPVKIVDFDAIHPDYYHLIASTVQMYHRLTEQYMYLQQLIDADVKINGDSSILNAAFTEMQNRIMLSQTLARDGLSAVLKSIAPV